MPDHKVFELSSGELYNFKLSLVNRSLYDSKGNINDISTFKNLLVSTLKAPLTSEDERQGKKQEDIRAVRVFVYFEKDEPIDAFFRRRFAKEKSVEYVARASDEGVHIYGERKIPEGDENSLFVMLAKEVFFASPFDDLGDVGKNIHNAVKELAPELNLDEKL